MYTHVSKCKNDKIKILKGTGYKMKVKIEKAASPFVQRAASSPLWSVRTPLAQEPKPH
jgi:hypothetical protein